MPEPCRTSAANIDEGDEVSIGGRWQMCEGVEHVHAADGSVDRVALYLDGIRYPGVAADRQLTVCK